MFFSIELDRQTGKAIQAIANSTGSTSETVIETIVKQFIFHMDEEKTKAKNRQATK